MLHSSDAEDWLKRGVCEAILVLCKSGLKFQSQFSINGLLAITVDQREVFLINIKETVGHSSELLPYNEDSMDGSHDLSCSNLSPTNQPRCPNGSRKVSLKRKNTDKFARKNSSQYENNSENTSIDNLEIQKQEKPTNSDFHGDNDNIEIDNNNEDGDEDGNSKRLYINEDNPGVLNLEQNSPQEVLLRTESHSQGFDLSLVKVEKEEDAFIPSDGHLQQSFHQHELQIYNAWQSNFHNGFIAARPRGRRPLHHEFPDEVMSEQLSHQILNAHHQQHSSQRRVAREGRCENCGTRKTTAWRRSDLKELLCNACGCYYKLHKYHRPLHMAQNEIKTRCRRSKLVDHLQGFKPPADRSHHMRGIEAEIDRSYFPGPIPS